jgi:hypothetical protein
MVTLQEVETQLAAIGANYRFWGRAEIVELQHILVPGERIQACLNGRYEGGFATFVATDQRLLLVDKKLFYLTTEDMRYDMIAEVDFSAQLFSGTVKVVTPTKSLTFTSYRPQVLRQVATHIQQRVMQVRHIAAPASDLTPAQGQPSQQPQPVVTKPIHQAGPFAANAPVAAPVAAPPAVSQPVTAADARAQYAQNPEPYASLLGNQAVVGAASTQEPALPSPIRRNPYVNPPLMVRRRIGRFGPIGQASQSHTS